MNEWHDTSQHRVASRARRTRHLALQCLLLLGATPLLPAHSVHADAGPQVLPPPGAVGSTAYVLASRANLRAQAQTGAPVLAQVVTNTPVKVIAKQGDWCEVDILGDAPTPPATASTRHGYMACNLLTPQALTLALVDAQLAKGGTDPKTALDWHARAFWIAPSMGRWVAVGLALESAHLDAATREREITEHTPLRFKVPEFEAMKQRLAAGVRVAAENFRPATGYTADDPRLAYMHVQAARQRIALPAVRPSFFQANETPVVISTAKFAEYDSTHTIDLIDALSAANGAPYRAELGGTASYARNGVAPILAGGTPWRLMRVAGAMDIIVGIWDTGGVHVTYSRDAVLHGVSVRGEPTALNINEIALTFGDNSGCSYARPSLEMKTAPVAGYAPHASAVVSWAGKPVPGGATARAQVKSRQISGASEFDLVVTQEIDLDRDGVADFLLWQGRYQPQVSAEGLWSAVFANVAGAWRLLDYVEDADCT
jgi:hypothetical protein